MMKVSTDGIILTAIFEVCVVVPALLVYIYILHDLTKRFTVFRLFEYNEPKLYNVLLEEWIEVKMVTGELYNISKSAFNSYDTYFCPSEHDGEVRVLKSSIVTYRKYSVGKGCLDVGEETFIVKVTGDSKKNPHKFKLGEDSLARIRKVYATEINEIEGYFRSDKVTGVEICYDLFSFYTISYEKEDE